MDDVALIESTSKSGRTVGLVLGAMLDLAGIIAYIADPSGTYSMPKEPVRLKSVCEHAGA